MAVEHLDLAVAQVPEVGGREGDLGPRRLDRAGGRLERPEEGEGRRLFDDGDAPYHLSVKATEAFPTGVIRVIYSPAEPPAKVGYDEVKDQVPGGE